MSTTVILLAMVSAGAVIALQGLLVVRGKRRARAAFFERPLLEAVSPRTEARKAQVLGRLRIVYGFFIAAVALWALVG